MQALSESMSESRWLDRIVGAMNSFGTLLIVALAILSNSDVLGRSFFRSPIPGVPELAGLALVAIVFLQIPYCLANHHMTRSDAFICAQFKKRPKLTLVLDSLWSLAGAAVFSVIAVAAFQLARQAWVGGEYEGAQGVFTVPVWPVRAAIVMGSACMVLVYLRSNQLNVQVIRGRQSASKISFAGGEV